MTVVSFQGVRPPSRYDGQPFTDVRIEEAAVEAGPWTQIDEQVIIPATDPESPPRYDITTENATLSPGWYRLIFMDAENDLTAPSQPVYSGLLFAFRPNVGDIGDIMRARTKDENGAEIGFFTENTRPTSAAVERMINLVLGDLTGCAGDWLPIYLHEKARMTVVMGVAALVELSYFPEQIDEDQSPYQAYNRIYIQWKKELCASAQPFVPEDQFPSDTPLYYFGDGYLGNILITPQDWLDLINDEATERYIFRGESMIIGVLNP